MRNDIQSDVEIDQQLGAVVAQRVRLGLWIALALLACFVAFAVAISEPLFSAINAIQLGELITIAGGQIALRKPANQRRAPYIALAISIVLCACITAAGIATDTDATSALLLVALVVSTATVVPWGWRCQLASVLSVALMLWGNIQAVSGSLAQFGYPNAAALALIAVGCVLSARELHRQWVAAFRQERARQESEQALLASERALRAKSVQLETVAAALTAYLNGSDWRAASSALLRQVVALTQSQLGFAGVVIDGSVLRVLAIEGVTWDADRGQEFFRAAMKAYTEQGYLEFMNLKTLFGAAITEHQTVRSNQPHEDARATHGLPAGHPPLTTFLGIPIVRGDQVVGMFAVANREGGYDSVDESQLSPLFQAAGVIFESYRQLQERIELERARRQHEEHVTALLDVARDVSGTLDFDEILARVQRRTKAVLGCDAVAVFQWNQPRQAYVLVASDGIPAKFAEQVRALDFRPGTSLVDHWIRQRAVRIDRASAGGDIPRDLMEQFHVGALMAAQLTLQGKPTGALVAYRAPSRPAFDAAQLPLLEGIARQLSLASETSDLYAAQHREAEFGKALAKVCQTLISSLDTPVLLERLCQVTCEVLNCERSYTWLWDSEANDLIPAAGYSVSEEIPAAFRLVRLTGAEVQAIRNRLAETDVAQTGRIGQDPELALGYQPGFVTSLYMALRRGNDLAGVQFVSIGRAATFSPAQERLAARIAQIASLALDNAQLVARLDAASRVKTDFVANMSHELRTPLNVIIGYADLLRDGTLGGELESDQGEAIRRISHNARGLLEMVSTTLDLSRFESGRAKLHLGRVPMQPFLRAIEDEVREAWTKPNVSFATRADPRLPDIDTDEMKLKMVVKNLLSNAMKFTDEGQVVFETRAADAGIELLVADTGIGIAPAALSKIFDAFQQADESISARYGGAGLGLHIAQRFVTLLGGKIAVESNVGQGSRFSVWLPLNHAGGALPQEWMRQ